MRVRSSSMPIAQGYKEFVLRPHIGSSISRDESRGWLSHARLALGSKMPRIRGGFVSNKEIIRFCDVAVYSRVPIPNQVFHPASRESALHPRSHSRTCRPGSRRKPIARKTPEPRLIKENYLVYCSRDPEISPRTEVFPFSKSSASLPRSNESVDVVSHGAHLPPPASSIPERNSTGQ